MSKNEMGYHTPKVTTEVSKRLLEANIKTTDLSWQHDEGDSLGIDGWWDDEKNYSEGVLWIPYEEKYKHFSLVIKNDDKDYKSIEFDTIEEVINYIKRRELINTIKNSSTIKTMWLESEVENVSNLPTNVLEEIVEELNEIIKNK